MFDEAQRILKGIKSTEYKHDTKIDEAKGSYYCDCSGFVGYVLNRTVGKNDHKGPLHNGDSRPVAMEYEKFFATAPREGRGKQPLAAGRAAGRTRGRGDVIAWAHAKPMPGNTGHVVIVGEKPVVESDGLVRVVVIDSTTKPQVDDTRAAGTSGIGRGTMWFKVDKEGRPQGYVRGSRKAEAKDEPISIGRALPTSEKPAVRRRAA